MKKILIIKPSSLGDIIHTFPVLTVLSRQMPGVVIDWLVRPEYAEFVHAHPAVRKTFLFDRKNWAVSSKIFQTAAEVVKLIRTMRKEKYDAALDLQGLFRSGLSAFLSGAKVRMGFSNAREGAPVFYNRKVEVASENVHAVDRYRLFLKELGLETPEADFNLHVPSEVEASLSRLLSDEGVRPGRSLVVLNPNARWETKRWLPERFATLAEWIVEKDDGEVLFIGAPSDQADIERISSRVKGRVHNLAGRTSLLQLAALLEKANLMITCDSGPMHLAAAVGTPVIALFGPTDPVRTGPYGAIHHVIQSHEDCAPCFKRDCPKGNKPCMESISVDEVFAAVDKSIRESVSKSGT